MASYPWPGLRWQCSSSMHPWGTQHSRRGARAWTDRPAVSLGVNKFGQGLFVVVLKLLRLEVGRLLGDDEAFTTVSLEFHKTRPAREFMTRMGDQPRDERGKVRSGVQGRARSVQSIESQ